MDAALTGSQKNPRYFHLTDLDKGLVISGWIEPASTFVGFKKFWEGEFDALKKSGMAPTGEPVPIYAYGPPSAAARFGGMLDNTDVPARIAAALGVEFPGAGARP